MDADFIMYIGRSTMETALMLAAPILTVTLVTGLLVAMIQAVTSIRDMTMGVILKILCVGLSILIFGGWMLGVAVEFTQEMFLHMRTMGG